MAIAVRSHGNVRILALSGEFTLEGGGLASPLDLRGRRLDDLGGALRSLLVQGCRAILLDMEQVTFLDSAALGELVACRKRAVQQGGDIALLRPVGRVRAVIEMVHLDRVFRVFDDEASALAALGG
jgi:anti-anti-sigma factor